MPEEVDSPSFQNLEFLKEPLIDLTAPAISPQNLFDFHAMDSRFHAAVELRSLGPLSDALLGQRRWDSPIVSSAARFLLAGGPEEEVAVNGVDKRMEITGSEKL